MVLAFVTDPLSGNILTHFSSLLFFSLIGKEPHITQRYFIENQISPSAPPPCLSAIPIKSSSCAFSKIKVFSCRISLNETHGVIFELITLVCHMLHCQVSQSFHHFIIVLKYNFQ